MTSFARFFFWWAGNFLALKIEGETKTSTVPTPTKDPILKLVYFNVAGIAQATRDLLNFFSIPFEDERLTREEFADKKAELPFGQLPTLTVIADGKTTTLAQSKSILRYVGRLTRTYPSKDAVNAAVVDQWCDLHTDFMGPLVLSMYPDKMGLSAFDREAHRAWIRETHLPRFLKIIDAALVEDKWISGMDAINIADFCWKPTLEWLKSGTFDGVSEKDFEPYDALNKYMTEIKAQFDDDDEEEDDAGLDSNNEEEAADEKKDQ